MPRLPLSGWTLILKPDKPEPNQILKRKNQNDILKFKTGKPVDKSISLNTKRQPFLNSVLNFALSFCIFIFELWFPSLAKKMQNFTSQILMPPDLTHPRFFPSAGSDFVSARKDGTQLWDKSELRSPEKSSKKQATNIHEWTRMKNRRFYSCWFVFIRGWFFFSFLKLHF